MFIPSLSASFVRSVLPERPPDAHKGTFGTLLVVAGSTQYPGAPCFAAQAALRSGVGIVTLAAPKTITTGCIGRLLEPTYLPLPETAAGQIAAAEALPLLTPRLNGFQAVLLGCGLGLSEDSEALVCGLLEQVETPLILDADGINCAARHIDILKARRAAGRGALVLTPHWMEMARLCDCALEEVRADPVGVAAKAAAQFGATVVLKSAETLIARSDGRMLALRDAANPGLAKGGSGDLLAGITGSLCAQGVDPPDAACAAVWLHSRAGFSALRSLPAISLLPSDVLAALPEAFAVTERDAAQSAAD